MQSLFLFADALESHVSDAEGWEKLLHLRRGLDALKGLLDGLLDVSRLDADAVQPTIEDFPIGELLEPIGAAFAKVAAAKRLEFDIQGCDTPVRSDGNLLTRILSNLLENAVRYTEAGRIRLQCRTMEGMVRIEVQDTGIGIPPEHLENIWTEFHQVGNPERDRNQGLGLGLAIVKRLAALLDHPVQVWSAPGRGSIFSIDVPVGTAPPVAQSLPVAILPAAVPRAQDRARFAVLVDDDAIVLLGLQAILQDWGYEVLAAGSTDQAVEGLRDAGRRPDIVVADYRLREGRFGTEAILRIRELYGGASIPGVILTGETGPECAEDAARYGMTVAHKPITARQLSSAMEKLLSEAAE
jgi:two-component system, sensor histidine kinase